MNTQSKDLWGPVKFENWRNVAFIKNKTAQEKDVVIGRAVFHIDKNEEIEHFALDIQIPAIVFQINPKTNTKLRAILIQGEKVSEREIVGLRYFEGGNGICPLSEIEYID